MKIWNCTPIGSIAIGTALLAALLIAGCGGGSSSTTGKAASVATTASTPATTATTTSTAAKPPSGKTQKKPTTIPSKPTTQPVKTPPAKTSSTPSQTSKALATLGKITLTSAGFKAGGAIPTRYTCDGADVSPPLEWHGVPHGAAELFLLAIDLSGSSKDAIQWAVGGIPPSASGLSAGSLPAGAVAGLNSAGKAGWGGVCGAKGQVHHVAFLFYALKQKLNLKSGFNPIVARNALKGSTLGTGLTLGVYNRP
ncbi:MAG TPA: YbhB/YbcL family Raf kinase inhibitor-like protein [Solirubrobacteraceae bacterium]